MADLLTNEFSSPLPTGGAIVFIDPSVDNYLQLVNGVLAGVEVVILDPTQDGVIQISTVLQTLSNLSAVHIISHGSAGSLQLGTAFLSTDTLDSYSSYLQGWASSLSPEADVLLYGCDVAAGEIGESFVQQLSEITGADVAASVDMTGNAALSGDWELEKTTGYIDAPVAVSAAAMTNYASVLDTTPPTVASIPISLVNLTVGNLTFTGTVQINPNAVNLKSSHFTNWNITVSDGVTSVTLNPSNSSVYSNSAFVTADGSGGISISGDPNNDGGKVLLRIHNSDYSIYYQVVDNSLAIGSSGIEYQAILNGNFQTAQPNVNQVVFATPSTTSSFSPLDNGTGVGVGDNLVVNFSEAIAKGSGNIVIKKVSDNSLVETIAVTDSTVTVSGSQLTINPLNDLAYNTDYYVEIANSAIADLAGNNFAGITGTTTWNFTTSADLKAPTVISFSPVDNGVGVAVGANLVINFSEAIQIGSGNIRIKNASNNSVVETIAVTSSNVTINGSQLTINPVNDLALNTDYYVEIAQGAIKDLAGNNFAGIDDAATWNFKTIDAVAPTFSSFYPSDNATGVAVVNNLVVNFNEAIAKGSGNIIIKKVSDNSVVETIAVTSSNVTVNGSQLFINPVNDLALNTDYYVEIDNGAIQDLAGNNFAGITGATTWNFKTATNPILNIAGDLDPSFGIGGVVKTDFDSGFDEGYQVIVQPDGKIVLAGYTENGSRSDFALVRYNSDGSLDTSFGNGGKVTTDFGYTDVGYSVTLQSDGKIVVAGYADNGNTDDIALVRYNSNGTLDSSFGNNGKVLTDFDYSYDYGYSVAIQSNGKILVSGSTFNGSNDDLTLTRYNSDGSIDTSFGNNGSAIADFGDDDYGLSVTIQTDGKIVVAGYAFNNSNETEDFVLTRYDSNGNLDTSFGSGGKVLTDLGANDYGYSVTLQSDGKIVVAGFTNNGDNDDFALTRYNSNGILDTSFGIGGKVITDFDTSYIAANDYSYSVTIQSDGKIVVAGYAFNINNETFDFAIARYNNNGTLDTSFGNNGKVITDLGGDEYGYSVAIQSDGNIIVAGSNNQDFALIRYLGSPTNIAPTDLNLSTSSVNENVAVNTIIGTFSTVDMNLGQTFTYSLVSGAGDSDNGIFSIVNGNQLRINASPDYESQSSYSIRVRTTDSGQASYEEVLTINVNDQAVFTIDNQTITEGDTGSQTMTFTVNLTDPISKPGSTATVNYATANGTAYSQPYDYIATSGSLTFATGETSKTIGVQIVGDTYYEPVPETFSVVLSNPTNGAIAQNIGTGTILDNEPQLGISVNDVSITEGNSGTKNLLFQVSLSAVNGQQVKVDYTTANGTATAGQDYTATSGTLTFLAGGTSLTVAVPIIGDTVVEADETFFLNLSNAVGGVAIADAQGVATILNDETAGGLTLTGTPGNDNLTGTSEGDILIGLAGADVLNGQAGADTFRYLALTDSLLNSRDSIYKFNPTEGDRLELPFLPTSMFYVGTMGSTISQTVVAAAYAAADGNTGLAANEAVLFATGSGATARLYLSVNDAAAAFNANSDLVVEVTRMVNSPTAVGALASTNYFSVTAG